MLAGDAGADFIGLPSDPDLVTWWSEIIEVPCVAFGVDTPKTRAALVATGADVVAVPFRDWRATPALATA